MDDPGTTLGRALARPRRSWAVDLDPWPVTRQTATASAQSAVARERDHLPVRERCLTAMAWGRAFAIVPCVKELISQRRPFIVK